MKIKTVPWLVLGSLLALCSLTPRVEAQDIVAVAGRTRAYNGSASGSQILNISLPSNTSSVGVTIENLSTTGTAVTFGTLAFQLLGPDTNSTPITLSCVLNATSTLPSQAAALYTNFTVNAQLMSTFYCPQPPIPRMQIVLNATAGVGQPISVTIFCSLANVNLQPSLVSSVTMVSNPTNNGALTTEKSGRWVITSTPAVSTQATATKAAVATQMHVADCVNFSGGSTTAPALTQLTVNLRAGISGAGAILDSWTIIIPATTGQNVAPFSVCGLNVTSNFNTAMTLEFSALLTNLFENVTLTGYDIGP